MRRKQRGWHLMGSFVECFCSPRLGATRWANMKSKWKNPTKGVEGGMTKVWMGMGGRGGGEGERERGGKEGGGLSLHPRPPESTKAHRSMKRVLMRTWLFRLCWIKTPKPQAASKVDLGAILSLTLPANATTSPSSLMSHTMTRH